MSTCNSEIRLNTQLKSVLEGDWGPTDHILTSDLDFWSLTFTSIPANGDIICMQKVYAKSHSVQK